VGTRPVSRTAASASGVMVPLALRSNGPKADHRGSCERCAAVAAPTVAYSAVAVIVIAANA